MITDQPIVPGEHLADFDPSCGAVVSFFGVVRNENRGRDVTGIVYECYADMAERVSAMICDEVKASHEVESIRVLHRTGEVSAGEISLLVIVTAPHRAEAFAASERVVDALKRRVPIWKKERYADGTEAWL
jgi:molybdopterin synthase catalytic subunit